MEIVKKNLHFDEFPCNWDLTIQRRNANEDDKNNKIEQKRRAEMKIYIYIFSIE